MQLNFNSKPNSSSSSSPLLITETIIHLIISSFLVIYILTITSLIGQDIQQTKLTKLIPLEDKNKNQHIFIVLVLLLCCSVAFILLSGFYITIHKILFTLLLFFAFIASCMMWDFSSRNDYEIQRLIFLSLTIFIVIALITQISLTTGWVLPMEHLERFPKLNYKTNPLNKNNAPDLKV